MIPEPNWYNMELNLIQEMYESGKLNAVQAQTMFDDLERELDDYIADYNELYLPS